MNTITKNLTSLFKERDCVAINEKREFSEEYLQDVKRIKHKIINQTDTKKIDRITLNSRMICCIANYFVIGFNTRISLKIENAFRLYIFTS